MKTSNGTTMAYSNLEEQLRADILSNRLSGGQPILPELELAQTYGISRNTVRRALENLVRDNLLRKVRGSGTFVIPAEERKNNRRNNCETQIEHRQVLFLSLATALSETAFRNSGTFEPMFTGVSDVLQPRGYNLLFSHVGLDWTPPPCLVNGDVSGVIFHGPINHDFWQRFISPLPHVGIQYVDPALASNWVKLDNRNFGFQAVTHLAKCGHSRIGFVADEIDSKTVRERFEGYLEGLRELNLPVRKEYHINWQRETVNGVLQEETFIPDYRPKLTQAFSGGKEEAPTAFVCTDDWRALGTMRALEKMGFSIPSDISLTGSYNEAPDPFGIFFSGFSCKLSAICAEASELLLDIMSNPGKRSFRTVLVRPEWSEGTTIAARLTGSMKPTQIHTIKNIKQNK